MIGALAGDIIGSVHEGAGTKVKDFPLFSSRCRVTDDSVMTLAVAEVITRLGAGASPQDYAARFRRFGRLYPNAGYGGSFRRWLVSDTAGPYGSWGNGSAMRSAPAGWAFDSEEEVLAQAARTAAPTHDHPEGIKGAQAVALAVFLARTGAGKQRIRDELTRRFGYNLQRTADGIRPGYGFDVSCRGSVPEAVIAFLDSVDFEDAIRTAISLGGDADTQACMAGAIAEAHYGGVPEQIASFILPRLDERLLAVTALFAQRYLPAPAREAVTRELRARKAQGGIAPRGAIEPRGAPGPRAAQGQRGASPEGKPLSAAGSAGDLPYRVLVSAVTWRRMGEYAADLAAGKASPGSLLARALEAIAPPRLDGNRLLEALLATKEPCVFAESSVRGDGRDWTRRELSLLGDIAICVPVTVFDDGTHGSPRVHPRPFRASLLFVPGALLQNGQGIEPADWEVVRGGRIDSDSYCSLYERRLLPALKWASLAAARAGGRALVTIPGVGCGQFAGKFRGTLGPVLRDTLARILERHAPSLPGLQAVWFDPYRECSEEQRQLGGISYFVRPSALRPHGLPQLCPPQSYAGQGDDFSGCLLSSVVAWDHVSWPGNDFYEGARSTDDGVKAAATDSMFALTGIRGSYDAKANRYQPPAGFRRWAEVVKKNGLRLSAVDRLLVVDTEAPRAKPGP